MNCQNVNLDHRKYTFPKLLMWQMKKIDITYPALHFPQTAFFVAVQGLIFSSLGSQIVHGLHEEKSCLSEYTSPGLHCTHCTVTSAVTRDPHCGTRPWPSGQSEQSKHSTALGLRIVSWFHLQFLLADTCAENWEWLVRIVNHIYLNFNSLKRRMYATLLRTRRAREHSGVSDRTAWKPYSDHRLTIHCLWGGLCASIAVMIRFSARLPINAPCLISAPPRVPFC